MKTILKADNITKEFGGLKAVDELTFEINEGDILGLIGPNGSGKSTAINMLSGLYSVTKGNIFFNDKNITHLKSHEINRIGLARTFQNIRLFPSLSVRENIVVSRYGISKLGVFDALFGGKSNKKKKIIEEGCDDLLNLVELGAKADFPADKLPYGQQKVLEISRALATNPKLLLLDEPAAGLNATEIDWLNKIVIRIKDMGITLLIVEHHMDLIMNICNRIVVLNYGRKIAEGNPTEIQNEAVVISAYLGTNKIGG